MRTAACNQLGVIDQVQAIEYDKKSRDEGVPPCHECHENAHKHKHYKADKHAKHQTIAGSEVCLSREGIDRECHCHTRSHASSRQHRLRLVLSAHKAEEKALAKGEYGKQNVVRGHSPSHTPTAHDTALNEEGDKEKRQG